MTAPFQVLWTSGWDSTYRVADLVLNQKQAVQPWYVIDSLRRSTNTELRTIERIREALITKDVTIADRLHKPNIIRREDIPYDREIANGLRNLASKGPIGSQNEWLASFAKAKGLKLELSVHRDDTSQAFLDGYTTVDSHGVHQLREDAPDHLDIFHFLAFPLLDLTKLDMLQRAQETGFDDIMEMTWFCHMPLLDGRPCGFCNPCKYTREEGLGRRVPPQTRLRKSQYALLFNVTRARSLLRRKLSAPK